MGDDTSLHRTGVSNPLGKYTAEFPKFKGPEEVKEMLEREAASIGMTLAEFIRELCIVRAYGKEKVQSLYAERLDVVAEKRDV